jgi:hypothetical protein
VSVLPHARIEVDVNTVIPDARGARDPEPFVVFDLARPQNLIRIHSNFQNQMDSGSCPCGSSRMTMVLAFAATRFYTART